MSPTGNSKVGDRTMTKRTDWWSRDYTPRSQRETSNDYLDDLDDLWADEGFEYERGKYEPDAVSRWGHAGVAKRAEQLVVARGMVKSFIQTFGTGDGGYTVTFDPKVDTAGTDFEGKKIVVSPAPALDPNLSGREAGLILTAMAVHEAAHVRYGRKTYAIVRRTYGPEHRANAISNVLADVQNEAQFVAEYPGYRGVFDPALEYVAEADKKAGASPHMSPFSTMVGAVRYAPYHDWTGLEAERDWWLDWTKRHIASTGPTAHLAAVKEALEHIETEEQAQQGQAQEQAQQGQAQPSRGNDRVSGPSGEAPKQGSDEQDEQGEQGDGDNGGKSLSSGCLTSNAEAAAQGNGVAGLTKTDLQQAEQIIEDSKNVEYLEDEYRGAVSVRHGNIPSSTSKLAKRQGLGRRYATSKTASARIKNALLQSRSGNTAIDRAQTRGRVDNDSIWRVALHDQRLFRRRIAPSPGKYLVWILVDRSGSMSPHVKECIGTARALGEAFRYVDSMRLEIFGWTSGSGHSADVDVLRAWGTGEPVDRIDALDRMEFGATPDAPALRYAVRAIQRAAKPGEQPIVVMMSDGEGYGENYIKPIVDEGRKAGVRVVSVAIGSDLDEDYQQACYGKDYISWQGSIEQTSIPLARMLGRLVAA